MNYEKKDTNSLLDLTEQPLDMTHLAIYLAVARLDNSVILDKNIAVAISCLPYTNQPLTLLLTRSGSFIKTTTTLDKLIGEWTVHHATFNWTLYQKTIESYLIEHNFFKEDHRMTAYLSDEIYFMKLNADYLLSINCIADYQLPNAKHLKTSQTLITTVEHLRLNVPRGKRSLENRLDRAHILIFSALGVANAKIDEHNNFLMTINLPKFMKTYFRIRKLIGLYLPRELCTDAYYQQKYKHAKPTEEDDWL